MEKPFMRMVVGGLGDESCCTCCASVGGVCDLSVEVDVAVGAVAAGVVLGVLLAAGAGEGLFPLSLLNMGFRIFVGQSPEAFPSSEESCAISMRVSSTSSRLFWLCL